MAENTHLIVANGHWPDESIWKPLTEKATHIIACDGAAIQCFENQIKIHTVIGDMDSLSEEVRTKIQHDSSIQYIEQEGQDENDLVKALKWSFDQDASSIEIIGIEGGDFAHQFAAILALCEVPSCARLHTSQCTIELLDKDGYKNCSIEKKTAFSLFAIGAVEGIQITGAKWNVKNETLQAGTRGLHNQTEENCLEVRFTSGQLLLFLDR